MEELLKVFISQPMKDKTNEEIETERARVHEELDKRFGAGNYTVLDSFFKDAPHNAKPLWYLGESFKLLAEADVAYFVIGYGSARGCAAEFRAAKDYGTPIIITEGIDVIDDDKRVICEYRR